MPTQKKFFVLYNCKRGFPGVFLHCIVVANTPEEVAQLLQGKYEDYYSDENGYRGSISLSKDLFKPSAKVNEEDYLEYKCGSLHLFILKDENGMKVSLEELPVMGRCEWHFLGVRQNLDRDCDEIGTLFADDCKMLCPDAYRLLIDDGYKEDKKDK